LKTSTGKYIIEDVFMKINCRGTSSVKIIYPETSIGKYLSEDFYSTITYRGL